MEATKLWAVGLALVGASAIGCGQGDSRSGAPESPILPAAAAPAHDDASLVYFEATVDPVHQTMDVVYRMPTGELVHVDDTLPYGSGQNQVYLHTASTSWNGSTHVFSGQVQLVNVFDVPIQQGTAVIDSVTPVSVTSTSATYSYGIVDGHTSSSAVTWSFNDPTDTSFTLKGHVTGFPLAFPSACPTNSTFVESWATDPIATNRWIPLAGTNSWSSGFETLNTASPNSQIWAGNRAAWANYVVSVPLTIVAGGGNGGLVFRAQDSPPFPAPNDSGHMYYAGIGPNYVVMGREASGWTSYAQPTTPSWGATQHVLKVTVNGTNIQVAVDGTTYVNLNDSFYATGGVGLRNFNIGIKYGPISVTCL